MLARKVLRNSVYNSMSVLVGNISGLVITIYLARALKPELFGIYSLAISVAFFLLTFTDLGINATVVRYGAHAVGKGDYALFRGYVYSIGKLKIALTLAVSTGLFVFSDVVSIKVFGKPALSTPLKIISGYIFSGRFQDILTAYSIH